MKTTMFGWPLTPLRLLSVAIALSACSGNTDETQTNQAKTARTTPPRIASSIDVQIQMTGLLLIAPPKKSGDLTHIVMPDTTGVGPHFSWLGFAPHTTGFDPSVCVRYKGGVCYVDLDEWDLAPIGTGGKPTPVNAHGNLHRRTVNITPGSGNRPVRPHGPDVRTRVTLVAGTAGRSCSIGEWQLNNQITEMANTQEWVIEDIPAASLTLSFTLRKPPGTPKTVVLAPVTSSTVQLLIVHVPLGDTLDLPPHTINRPVDTMTVGDTAYHFAAFYKVLDNPQARHLPTYHGPSPQTGGGPCPLEFETWYKRFSIKSVRTHSCMVASAEQG